MTTRISALPLGSCSIATRQVQATAEEVDAEFASFVGYGFEPIGPPHARYPKGYDDVVAVYTTDADFEEAGRLTDSAVADAHEADDEAN
jgi:hypothetical protein